MPGNPPPPKLDRLMEKKRSFELNYLNSIVEIIASREFGTQIRSEECGCCTCAFAEQMFDAMLEAGPYTFECLGKLSYHIESFHHLPRFTLKILSCLLQYMASDIDEIINGSGDYIVPSSHQLLYDAIRELVNVGEKYAAEPKWLWFCRIAQPILLISKPYNALCDKINIPKRQRANDYIESIERKKESFEKNELEKNSTFAEYGRSPELHTPIGQRENKRLWSGGVCSIYEQGQSKQAVGNGDDPLIELIEYCKEIKPSIETKENSDQLLKIWNFSRKAMLVFSRHTLQIEERYDLNVCFNSIDIPFKAQVTIEKEMEIKKDNPSLLHRYNFMDKYKFDHCYILRFAGDPTPEYYFLAMCHDLYEQQREWDADTFGSMFCGSFWHHNL